MIYPQIEYVVDHFTGSNSANCPIIEYFIEPIAGGTKDDYGYTTKDYNYDKKTKKTTVKITSKYVSINSTITDPKITLHVPNFNASNMEFNFRIRAVAEGGSQVLGPNIKIYKVNCDWEAVLVNASYVVQSVDYIVKAIKYDKNNVTTLFPSSGSVSLDVSHAFLPV